MNYICLNVNETCKKNCQDKNHFWAALGIFLLAPAMGLILLLFKIASK